MLVVPINHICLNEKGSPFIYGTRIKVSHIVIEHQIWKKTPEAIQQDFPHLSLSQIFAALAYYFDHQKIIDTEINNSDQYVKKMANQQLTN